MELLTKELMRKSIYSMLLFPCMAIAFSFSACGEEHIEQSMGITIPTGTDQDENSSDSDESSSNNYVLLSATEISSVNVALDEFSNPIYEVYRGRSVLKSYDRYDEASYCTFTYSLPYNVAMHCPSLYDVECTVNEKGLISEAAIGRELHIYEYDSRNRPVMITVQYGSLVVQFVELAYDDKFNIIGYKKTDDEGKIIDEAEIEYTTIPSKAIPLQCLDVSVGDIFGCFYEWPFIEMGLYGNVIPLYLIQRIVYTDGAEIEFDYTLDRNGYVTRMVKKNYGASKTYISTWNFEWKEVSTPSYTNWLFSDVTSPYYRYLQ